jgi:hypothetical protein
MLHHRDFSDRGPIKEADANPQDETWRRWISEAAEPEPIL